MAEICIMVEDVEGASPSHTLALMKRGDVVDVLPDGFDWGDAALASPRFRMIALPNVSLAAARAFLAPEAYVSQDDAATGRVLRPRGLRFRLTGSGLPASFAAWLANDARPVPILRITSITTATLANFRLAK